MSVLLKPLTILVIIITAVLQDFEKERWIVEESSELRIKGSSNINEFTCSIKSRSHRDTLIIDYSDNSHQITFVKNEVRININAFDCQNPIITTDLKKTLNADKYPDIILKFLSLERPTFRNFASQEVEGKIEIKIAGTVKSYPIIYQMTPKTDGTILLKGIKKIDINDFALSTPSKLMGLIKVDEEIEVDFNMTLKQLL